MEDFSSIRNFSSFIIDYLQSEFREDPFWNIYLQEFNSVEPAPHADHLAIFIEPYLQFILDGKEDCRVKVFIQPGVLLMSR